MSEPYPLIGESRAQQTDQIANFTAFTLGLQIWKYIDINIVTAERMWSALLVALLTWASSFACLATAQNASQSAGADMAGASVQLQQCLAEAATQLVDNIRANANFSSREASIRNATWELAYLGRACFKANLTTIRPIRILAPSIGSFPVWQRRAVEFEALTGIPVVLEPVSFFTNAVEIFLELQSSPIRDGWILDPAVTGTVALYKGFADLGPLIRHVSEATLLYNDILPFYRLVSGVYNKRIIGLPMDGDNFLLYYRQAQRVAACSPAALCEPPCHRASPATTHGVRRPCDTQCFSSSRLLDLFQRYQLDVPQTWSDLLDMARLMNGTDTDGDGRPDLFGACLDMMPQCKISFHVAGMAASYIQNNGTQSGFWYDPDSDEALMRPLVGNNEAMRAVLQLLADLQAYMPSEPTCSNANPAFLAGKCLMTIDWGGVFRATRTSNISRPGMLGIAPLPGSTQILDRTTLKLVNCTPALCPMAQPYRTARVAPNVTRTLSGAWVNSAPFLAFGGWTAGVAAASPPEVQLATLNFFAYLTSPNNSWADVLDVSGSVDPFRQQHLDPANIGRWTAAGYDQGTTLQYLSALRTALFSPNIALDARMAYVAKPENSYRNFLENGFWAAYNKNMASSLLAMESSFVQSSRDALQLLAKPDPLELRQQYWYMLGRVSSVYSPRSPPLAPNNSVQRVDNNVAVIITACLIGGCILLVGLGLLTWQRVMWMKRNHRSALGKLLPPGAGPDTTLVLTDVQDSTTLYECLPVEVMDACMRIAERIILRAPLRGTPSCAPSTHPWTRCSSASSEGPGLHGSSPMQQCRPRRLARAPDILRCCPWCVPCCHPVTVSLSPHFNKIVQALNPSSLNCLTSSTAERQSLARCFLHVLRRWSALRGVHADRAPPLSSSLPASVLAQSQPLATRPTKDAQPEASGATGRLQQVILPRWRSVLKLQPGPTLFTPDDWLAWAENYSVEQSEHSRTHHDTTYASPDSQLSVGSVFATLGAVWRMAIPGQGPQGLDSSAQLPQGSEPPSLEQQGGQRLGASFSSQQGEGGNQATLALAPPASYTATTTNMALTQALHIQEREHAQGDAATPSCLVFSGLRIRCGVHTGVSSAQDVSYNTSSARMQYSGAPLALARAVCDAAQGAQILLSQACFAALPQQQLRDAVAQALPLPKQARRMASAVASSGLANSNLCGRIGQLKDSGLSGNTSHSAPHCKVEVAAAATPSSASHGYEAKPPGAPALGKTDNEQRSPCSLILWHAGEYVLKVGHAVTTVTAGSLPNNASALRLPSLDAVIVSMEGVHEQAQTSTSGGSASRSPRQALSRVAQQLARNAARRSSLALVAAEHCMSPEAAEALHSKPGQQVLSLYSVLPAGLAPRLVLLGAPRAVRQTVPGALSAPYGGACVCFLYVVGLAELLAWDPQEAASALALFSALIKQQLMTWNGYLEHLKQLPWSDRLLAHPLAESLITAEMGSNGEARQTLVYRGLRIKVGADVGSVRSSLQPVTGVVAFRGRVMNRAARIASRAGSGQVLCSAAVWAHWAGSGAPVSRSLSRRAVLGTTPELGSEGGQLLPRLSAVSQGLVPLKGVPEQVEVMQ
ncbi:guanylate cyclase domain-containing protein, partial [Haematococcus lacustris]